MKRGYIAGRLSDIAVDYIKNMHRMMYYAEEVRKLGFAVMVPCLDVLMGMKFGNYEYSDYAYSNMAWLEVSDFVFVCPNWECSSGTLHEMARAKELNIPIYFNLHELEMNEKENPDNTKRL